jgi:hypothetical protein
LIKAINQLLLPAGGSPMIAANTYTLLLRALATSVRASPQIAITLLEADIVDTLYQILTGVLPSPSESESHTDQGGAASGQGLGGGLADMTVMENMAHRPKDQVEEALSLVSELLPPLPKGEIVFYFHVGVLNMLLQMGFSTTKDSLRNHWPGWLKRRQKLIAPRLACSYLNQRLRPLPKISHLFQTRIHRKPKKTWRLQPFFLVSMLWAHLVGQSY